MPEVDSGFTQRRRIKMRSTHLARVVSAMILTSAALTAQTAPVRDMVPLKPWAAPLYWLPTSAESQAAAAAQAAAAVNANADLPGNALVLVGITPCRLVDTRAGQGFIGEFGPPGLAGNSQRTFVIQSSTTCAIPSIAQAYSLSVTVVPHRPLGFLTVYPTGQPVPLTVTMTSLQGLVVTNPAIAQAGTGGSVDVYASDPTDLVIDVNGYYVPQGTLAPVALSQGTAATPALSFPGDPGTGVFSSGKGVLNLAAGGKSGVSLNSTGDMKVTGAFHASGPISSGAATVTIDGNSNSIVVDAKPPNVGNPSELYFGGDDNPPPAKIGRAHV